MDQVQDTTDSKQTDCEQIVALLEAELKERDERDRQVAEARAAQGQYLDKQLEIERLRRTPAQFQQAITNQFGVLYDIHPLMVRVLGINQGDKVDTASKDYLDAATQLRLIMDLAANGLILVGSFPHKMLPQEEELEGEQPE